MESETFLEDGLLPGRQLLKREYWCFISYRHSDNELPGRQWATWLHQALETYEVPSDLIGKKNERDEIIPECIFPVFRDEEELPADAELSRPIESALRRSRFLVVICSPQAVASRWVSDEILYFKQVGRQNQILAAIIKGTPNSINDPAKTGANSECFPVSLRFELGLDGALSTKLAEPIAADFRLADGNEGWTSPAAFREALKAKGLRDGQIADEVKAFTAKQNLMFLKIVAGVLGVPLGVLTQRDRAYQLEKQKQRARVLRRWLVLASFLTIVASTAGLLAYRNGIEARVQRDSAEEQRKSAVGQKMEADIQRKKTSETLSQSDFLQGLAHIEQGKDAEALAYLARAISLNPENKSATARLYSLLISQRSWNLLKLPPLRHKDLVRSARFSHDGKYLLTASYDHTAQLWDTLTGLAIGKAMQHQADVVSAKFCHDSSRVVTASNDGTARLWSGRTGEAMGTAMQHAGGLISANFSPDGTRIVTSSEDSTCRIWSGITGEALSQPLGVGNWESSSEFSPDGSVIVTASGTNGPNRTGECRFLDGRDGHPLVEDFYFEASSHLRYACFSPDGKRVAVTGNLKHQGIGSRLENSVPWSALIIDAQTHKVVGVPMRHEGTIGTMCFSPDGTRILTASDDKTARLWDAFTGRQLGHSMSHSGIVHCATFSPDGHRISTTSIDRSVRFWHGYTCEPISEPIIQPQSVVFGGFCADGNFFATASRDQTARIWDVRDGRCQAIILPHVSPVIEANFSMDDTKVVTASEDAKIWDASTGFPIGEGMKSGASPSLARFLPNGTHLITAYRRPGSAKIWEIKSSKQTGETMTHIHSYRTLDMHDLAHSPCGKMLATSANGKEVKIWDGVTGMPKNETLQHDGSVYSASFSDSGNYLVTVSKVNSEDANDERNVQIWDMKSYKPALAAKIPSGPVLTARFSPDDTKIVTASWDKKARILNATSGLQVGNAMIHDEAVYDAKFVSNGKFVVTVSRDKTARLWDANSGTPVGTTMRHNSEVISVKCSSDGQRILTLSENGMVHVWDNTGQPICDPLSHSRRLNSAVFNSDATCILTASDDETARIWTVLPPASATTPPWLPRLAEAVGGMRILDSGALDSVDPMLFFTIKVQLQDGIGSDFWSRVGRWFFADRDTRNLSPLSEISITDYRKRFTAKTTLEATQNHNSSNNFSEDKQSFYLLSQAAELGDSSAQFQLAQKYLMATPGVEKNPARAAELLALSANQGNSGAQYLLGYCYFTGMGVGRDLDKAKTWFEKAAKAGNENAQMLLSRFPELNSP